MFETPDAVAYDPSVMDAARLKAHRDLAQQSFPWYQSHMFRQTKGYHRLVAPQQTRMSEALMKVFRGETKRLIINVPPRYFKTQTTVVDFASWCYGMVPDCEFIHASYASGLAERNSSDVQFMMAHEAYRRLFPATRLNRKASGHWSTTAGGKFLATGMGGTITGFGAGKMRDGFSGAILIDDPHKPDEATSDVIRQGAIDWYQNTLQSRVNSPDTPIILTMQRLHEEDLAGWLLAGGSGEHWDHVCIPAINERGEALWPEKHTIEKLREMERKMPYVFAGQYMQRPSPLGGGIFKDAYWSWYNPAVPRQWKRIIQSWDTAIKVKETNDYSVCTTWGELDNGYYLIDIWKQRVEFPELMAKLTQLAQHYQPHAILVEDKASGQQLIQMLRSTRYPIIPIMPVQDKVARAHLVTPIIESGRVFLPEGHPLILDYVHSHGQFPNGSHCDDVDSTTQALSWASRAQSVQKTRLAGL